LFSFEICFLPSKYDFLLMVLKPLFKSLCHARGA
jgi:hypothetical protein